MHFVGERDGVGAQSWGRGRSLLRGKQMGNERYREKAAVSFNIPRDTFRVCLEIYSAGGRSVWR